MASTFYDANVLTKRGPLARVWMASHLSSKLTKSNLLATSIPTSVSSILGNDVLPMALRLSGQLLLGVARIYSRKAKYLLDDCAETLAKVKKAFRPGAVDMDEGEGGRNKDNITLRAEQGGLEDLLNFDAGVNLWDMNLDAGPVAGPSKPRNAKAKTSAAADITLPEHHNAFGAYDDFDLGGMGEAIFDYGPEGAIESQDFEGLDLGLEEEVIPEDEDEDADEETRAANKRAGKRKADALDNDDEDGSVEAGRDAAGSQYHASARGSIGPLDGLSEADLTMDKIGGDQIDLDLGGEDFVFDAPMGDDPWRDMGGGDEEQLNGDREKTPQANGLEDGDVNLTPKTAADLAKKPASNKKKAQKIKKQVIDRVTELDWEGGNKAALEARKESLFTDPSFLPRSRTQLLLLERAADPNYYLPKPLTNNLYLFAPPNLAPELRDLYKFPSRRALIKSAGKARAPSVEEIEAGRREVDNSGDEGGFLFPEDDVHRDMGGGDQDEYNLGHEGYEPNQLGDETFQFDDVEMNEQPDLQSVKSSQRNKRQKLDNNKTGDADTVVAGEAEEEDDEFKFTESEGPLAVFDDARSSNQFTQQTSTQQTQSLGEEEEEALYETGMMLPGKWSKNTVKAVGVLRNELDREDEEQKLEFGKLSQKASKRAAASMFFELLVLSTRDCIKIEQKKPFDEIFISAEEKLWSGVQNVEA